MVYCMDRTVELLSKIHGGVIEKWKVEVHLAVERSFAEVGDGKFVDRR